MNRHERRARSKISAKSAPVPAPRPSAAAPPAVIAPPSLLLRGVASILLASWLLKRVHNPQVFVMLRQVAVQAGREDAVREIDARIQAGV